MSDIADQTAVDAPVEDGTGVETVQTAEESTPEAWADWETYADQYVPVKVNGEESLVPLRDAVGGYMRNSDYTQKTQEIASERQRLSQAQVIYEALERDPERAIELLQTAYLEGQQAQQGSDEPEFLSEEERRIHELESWKENWERRESEQQVRAQLEDIVQRTGVDANELVEFAISNNIPNLEWAYSHYAQAKSYAEAVAQQQQSQAEAARLAAKQAAVSVEGGGGRNPGATETPKGKMSFEEAARAAFETHNVRF